MSLLNSLLRQKQPFLQKKDGSPKTSGELISEVTDGANLVDGKQTWELAEVKKNDLEDMKRKSREGMREVRRLSKLLNIFDQRLNMLLGVIFNGLFLFDFYLVINHVNR